MTDGQKHLLPKVHISFTWYYLNSSYVRHGDNSVVWKGFTATVVIIAFFVLDRTMAALGHGHSHGHGHDEEEGSTSDETRTTRESTPDMKSSLDIKPILKDSNIPKLSLASKVIYH